MKEVNDVVSDKGAGEMAAGSAGMKWGEGIRRGSRTKMRNIEATLALSPVQGEHGSERSKYTPRIYNDAETERFISIYRDPASAIP
jgi:hypothetical protein